MKSIHFLLLLLLTVESCYPQATDQTYPLDILEPIVRISPARKAGDTADRFGYAALAHQLKEVSTNSSYLEALSSTVIMVGAPNGKFPGGLVDVQLSGFACKDQYPSYTDQQLLELPMDNITDCYGDIIPGLVYTCPISSGDCKATLGNNDATGPDGLLFDRVGNLRRQDPELNNNGILKQNKSGQLMGAVMYSTKDYFVACAPLWEFAGMYDPNSPFLSESEPLGQCVYSTRNLSGFALLSPAIPMNDGSNNQNEENFCTFGSAVHISVNNSNPLLAAGSPARYFSSGGVFYYNDLNNFNDLLVSDEKSVYVPANHKDSTLTRRTGFLNVNGTQDHWQTYYGSAITSGYITSTDSEDFVASAPRWSNDDLQLGRVFIVTQLNAIASIFVEGEQFGEYFGNAIASADLDNDGWNDLIVGAPLYSKSSLPEIGRIYIFHNEEGHLNKSSVIEGFVASGRFGYSIESIGDVNDDGYADFAVSAPYEDSGVVYIYYGQEMDSNGAIVNSQYAQRIDGGSFVDRVSNISEVSMFGFSLSGNLDVDNNQYNDLVIGAFGSQTVFLLRSRPFAIVNITSSFDVALVSLISYECTNDFNQPSSCFTVTVCASFSESKGIQDGFTTNYTLSEDITGSQRLYFKNYTDYSISRSLTFTAPDTESCDNVTVYVLNSTLSLDFRDFELKAEMEQVTRSVGIVDTNQAPTDLSQYPRIISEPVYFTVPVDSQCGEDNICDLDLHLTHTNTTFLGLAGDQFGEQSFLTLDAVSRVDVHLSFANLGEDVFGYMILFPLPRAVFIHRLVLPQSSFFTCNDTTPDNSTHANLVCTNQQPFLSISHDRTDIYIRWLVNRNLRGATERVQVPITILPDPDDSRNRELNTTNNMVMLDIEIRSQAEYQTTLAFGQSSITYGNHTPIVNDIASNLGEELRLTATIKNNGPSTIYNAELTIYIPANTSEAPNSYYYYYPAAVEVTSGNIQCSDSLNPQNFRNISSSDGRRRRRSTVQRYNTLSFLSRFKRQDIITDDSYDLDCTRAPEQCVTLKCNITNIVGSASLDIIGFIDERFYKGKSQQYRINAYATVNILDSFTDTNGSTNTATGQLILSEPIVEEGRTIPWYYIAPPAIGGFLIIIILAVILYFVGFFRRKKNKKLPDEDTGVEQFVSNPFGDGKSAPVTTKSVEKTADDNN